MYVPAHFAEADTEAIHRLVDTHPLGTLVTHGSAGLDACHLPFHLDPAQGEHGHLLAHVARNNPVWQQQRDGDAVLVVFHGPQAYVSPNWYPSKHELHRQVPTWNYQAVHAYGRLLIRDDERFVRGVVARLTRTHENRSEQPRPWTMGDSEPDYINRLLTLIVGIEVVVERWVGVNKLSQNKDARDHAGVVDGLRGRGQHAVADAMAATRPAAGAA